MKKLKIVTGLLLLVGFWLWTILVWTEPTQLNSESRPQTESLTSSLIKTEYPFSLYALYSKEDKNEVSETIVIENCEYMKNLNGPPPAANTNYVHKGNCKNSIHPENTIDWSKMNKLLNSSLLKNILK